MSTVVKHTYYVKRLVSGATSTNTINIYNPLRFSAKCEVEEECSMAAGVVVEDEPLSLQARVQIDPEPEVELSTDVDVPWTETLLAANVVIEPEIPLSIETHTVVPPLESENEVDPAAMAAAMIDAAERGVPFCEQCTRARL